MAKGHSLAKDFVGGLDPFGVYTTQYGQKAQERGESKGSHRKRRAIATAGGVVGGSLLVPSGITALVEGAKGIKGGPRGVARGLARGAAEPISKLIKGRAAVKSLRKIKGKKGAELSRQETSEAISRVGALFPKETRKQVMRDIGGVTGVTSTQQQAKGLKKITPMVEDTYRTAKSQIGLGGAVGAGGAYVQYGKGRESEKGFKKRLDRAKRMKKTASTLQGSFEDVVLHVAEHYPYLFQSLDKLAYHAGSDAPEDVKEDAKSDEEEEDRRLEPGVVEKALRARKLLSKKEKGKKKAISSNTGVAEQPVSSDEENPAEKVARLTRLAYLSH